ncbi:sigma-70 family RNA polymerase sigma factor [Planomonospora sp. ID67723]|nr:sigma-70 family RNA polymerase sigma factor [Planomonospora sp. ID67723]
MYQEFGASLLRYVRKATGNDLQWAEDVVQETLLRAWQNAGKLRRERGLLWAWLLTVARRIIIDDRRRRGVRPQEVEPAEPDAVSTPDGSERSLEAMIVSEALQELSQEHREAIEHTYLRDRTIGEAAEILGIPPGTVKSRLYYGIRALRGILKEKGVAS